MYARVTTAQIQPGKTDDGIQIVRDAVLPAARQQPGFKGLWQLVDRSNNTIIVISFWETEADMKGGESSGYYQAQIAKVAPVLAAQPVWEADEVSMQHMQEGRTSLYARVTTFQLQPGKIGAWIQLARDSVIAGVQQQQGYKGGLVLADESANKIKGITLWETEADVKAGETSGYVQERIAQVASVLSAPPVLEAYEVSIHE